MQGKDYIMANTIDTAFIKQFESEVHLAYQRMGSKLMNTVRNVSNVAGSVVRFQKIGTGTASTKSRNGMVTPMELTHTTVEATLADYYAAEYIDKLDELKTNIDERQAIATSAAAALGRKTDEILVTAMDAGANSTQLHDTSSAVEKADLLSAFETFGTANIPEDGQRYIAMHPKGFADLFLIEEFASSDYVGDQNLPYAGGMTMKNFLGFNIMSTSAITAGNGMVTPMELTHTTVEATLADYYAAEYIDKLDELKTNIDERQAIATSAAAALGRKTDEILVTAMDAGANSTQLHDTSSAVEKADLLSAFETFGTANIPEDGQRYIAMHPKGFADLFLIEEFASSDYVGDQNLPYAGGMTMKNFLGFNIMSTSAITAGKNLAYHTSSVGLGIGANVTTELNYVPEKVSHLATSMMSMGASVIDDNGIYELLDNN